jgi:hypothetical protein
VRNGTLRSKASPSTTLIETVRENTIDDRAVFECADIATHTGHTRRATLIGAQGHFVLVDAALVVGAKWDRLLRDMGALRRKDNSRAEYP